MTLSLSDLQQPLIKLAQETGRAILEIYESSRYTITAKADHSPLTQADLLAHEILVNGLQQLTPDFPVLSEEGANTPWEERSQWTHYWLIDPLDGTRQFISHEDEFTVNIALVSGQKPVIGILYIPVTQETYYACYAWGGAFKLSADGHTTAIKTRPWRKNETIILASQTTHKDSIENTFARLGQYKQVEMSSSWKFARIAEGSADIYPRLGNTSEWDTAAGQCILEQAGGALTDLQGRSLSYNTKESLINPHFVAFGDSANLYSALFSGDVINAS
jgi:3'(2'), 5'-bisphosphate nucleotidase